MLPCLECAAFRTWVMPSLCNVFLFCATALRGTQQHRENKEQTRETVSYTGSPFEQVAELMKVSLQQSLQTQDTHTFPMYRLGQTSSTGVSSSVQESKMSCSSLMSTRSCCFLLPDILPAERSSNRPGHCSWCLHPPEWVWTAHWGTRAGGCSLSSKISSLCSASTLPDWMWSYLT